MHGAILPNTRTLLAPWAAAMARILSRRAAMSSEGFMTGILAGLDHP